MAPTPARMLLFFGGAATAALATAYGVGVFEPVPPAAPVAVVPAQPQPVTPTPQAAAPPKPAEQTTATVAPKQERQAAVESGPDPQEGSAAANPLLPTFDLLRAEPDGSVVIAGKAAAEAEIEILSGAQVVGRAKATPDGDFAAVLDEPLKPGDYQLTLRSTAAQSKVIAESKQTAVVSIPASKDGQVLAMVEEPGAASRIMARPETPAPAAQAAPKPAETAQPAAPLPAEQPQVAATEPENAGPQEPASGSVAEQTATPEPVPSPAPEQATAPVPGTTFVPVAVEAVEIEGRKLFVAGAGPAGAPVRVYANDQLVGETRASSAGRFLLEVERELPVGAYQIRADALSPDGKVIARAEVGFTRDPGDNVAAVASEPQPQAARPAVRQPEVAAAPAQAAPDQAAPQTSTAAPPQPAQAQAPGEPAQPQEASQQPASEPQLSTDPAQVAAEQTPTLKNVSSAVIIRRGDSLWRISRRVYGRGVRFSTIYLANDQQIRDPNRIYPGQVFRVPEKTEQGEQADMNTMGDQATTVE